MIVLIPINSILTKRSVKIQKGRLAARDQLTSLISELIGAVSTNARLSYYVIPEIRCSHCDIQIKLVKFFGWEDSWIKRIKDASRSR